MRGGIILWLLVATTLFLLFSSRPININDSRKQQLFVVDAAMRDTFFSYSSRNHQGYGLSNNRSNQDLRRRRGRQQDHYQTELQQRQRRRRRSILPWLLPHRSLGIEVENKNENDGTVFALVANNNDVDAIVPWRIATASFLKLRGGSSSSSSSNSSSNNSSSNTVVDKDKNRSSKQKDQAKLKRNNGTNGQRKNKNKNKRKQHADNSDGDNDEKDGNDIETNDEELLPAENSSNEDSAATTTESTPKQEEPPSKLFLIDPFRMNEIARYEASIAEEPSPKEANNDKDVDVDDDATEEIAASISGSDDEDGDIDIDSDSDNNSGSKKKQRNKKIKKKRDSVAKATTTDTVESSSVDGEYIENLEKHANDARNGKKKKHQQREQQPQRGKRNHNTRTTAGDDTKGEDTSTALAGSEEEDVDFSFDGDIDDSSIDDDDDAAAAADTDQSNSFWWVDVWTQQLSDPEDFEENDVLADDDVLTDVDGAVDGTDFDATNEIKIDDDSSGGAKTIAKEGEKRMHKKKVEKEQEQVLPSPIEENTKLLVTPDVHNDTPISTDLDSLTKTDETDTSTKLTENEIRPVLVLEQTVTATVSKAEAAALSYVSSGAWVLVDNLFTIGLASQFSSLRVSRKLRRIRKLSARITRLHGLLSGKPRMSSASLLNGTTTNVADSGDNSMTDLESGESIEVIEMRIAAIDRAREGVMRAQAEEEKAKRRKRGFWGFRPKDEDDLTLGSNETKLDKDATTTDQIDETEEKPKIDEPPKIPQKSQEEIEAEFQRMERVREIDRLISEGQQLLADLVCEKDVLQRRPNPLFDYTTKEIIIATEGAIKDDVSADEKNETKLSSTAQIETNTTNKVEIQATREMNFPSDDLVAEYLDMMLSTRRLTKMNHTDLWKERQNDEDEDEEDESIGDDLFTPSANAHRLYQGSPSVAKNGKGNGSGKNGKKNGGGGSWLLRQSIGSGRSLGEKIGEAAETAAYKAVASALMGGLARSISSLHGINVMKHSDIRLFLEQSPDLPPVPKDGIINGNHQNYAEETIKSVMRRKTRRSKKRSKHRLSDASFVQQEAVTETLLSHVQISAPLLKLFPLAWQRALLGNIIALSCALISDFLDGLHFQILGHQLSFAFRPITEVDMARHVQMAGGRYNQRRYKAAEFEAAVQATAEDLKEELKFLDSWHERALGSGVLRTQIANMIARIVLTLTDEVLSGARMDLWSVQAGGPRMLAGLEHRIEEDDDDEEE
jgi:hypothetical protein